MKAGAASRTPSRLPIAAPARRHVTSLETGCLVGRFGQGASLALMRGHTRSIGSYEFKRGVCRFFARRPQNHINHVGRLALRACDAYVAQDSLHATDRDFSAKHSKTKA